MRCFQLRSVVTLLLLLSICSAPRAADVVPWLYEAAIAVENQSLGERERAASLALLRVLSRVTGLAYVPRTPQVSDALANADRYYNEFRFTSDEALGLKLVVQFDSAPVLDLVRRADLPIWRASREKVLAWVVLQQGVQRTILGATSESPLVDGLSARARDRGVPLTLPLLDLEDQLNVDPAAVWGRLTQVLEPASQRYEAEMLLLGRVDAASDGSWRGDWEFWIDGVVVPFATEGVDLTVQAAQAVDLLSDELAARRVVLGRQAGEVRLAVAGIRTPVEYGALLNYLASLEFVDEVTVAEVRGARLILLLKTPAGAAQLLAAFERDRRMFEDQLAVTGFEDLKVLWRSDD